MYKYNISMYDWEKPHNVVMNKVFKVIEKCTNSYFGTEKLLPKFYDLISIVKKIWACWPPNRFSVRDLVWQRCQVCYSIGV